MLTQKEPETRIKPLQDKDDVAGNEDEEDAEDEEKKKQA